MCVRARVRVPNAPTFACYSAGTVPEAQIQEAKEAAKMKLRVASRKLQGEALEMENKKIKAELQAKIGKPNLPRSREKGSPNSVMG